MIGAMTEAMLDVQIDAVIDPSPPFTFCRPQAIVDQDAEVSIPNSSPFSRSTRFPFTYPFAARAPCDSQGSECQCGIHTAEATSALRSRKTERAAKEKPTPISQFFLAPAAPWHPNSPPRPGEAPHPAPSARKSATQTAQKTALCAPCELPGGSESENPPATRGTAHSEVQGDDRGND